MRKVELAEESYYHLYNRGVDKRNIFGDQVDVERFLTSIKSFNDPDPIGSIYEQLFEKREPTTEPIITVVSYALNPNHYHLLVKQNTEKGIENFMHRLGTGYTNYFNRRHRRSGSLFQGKYKARLIEDNEDLLHINTYVNFNPKIHLHFAPIGSLGSSTSKWGLARTSWDEHAGIQPKHLTDPGIILDQFEDFKEYQEFSQEAFQNIVDRKVLIKELEGDLEVELPSF